MSIRLLRRFTNLHPRSSTLRPLATKSCEICGLTFHKARAEDAAAITALAWEIWTEHYTPIIGKPQVDYMLERFQSEQAVREQIEQGYDYYIACEGGRALAYFALLIRQHDAQLSKIYVRKNARRRNIGRRMTEYAEARCREENVTELWLTVNRHNSGSIAFYEKMGFIKSRELVQDIGNGFVMDDYVMSKVVASEHF